MSDPRVRRGLERQLAQRRQLLVAGHSPLGWKAGFGAPAAREKFGLAGPLVGFMTDGSVMDEGSVVSISGWNRPVAEPELAVWIGQDVPPAAPDEQVRNAISALAPAIELADVDPPPDEVEDILVANIFHRGVVLGAKDTFREGGRLEGLEARISLGGEPVEPPRHLEDLTGRIVDVISHLALLLADHSETIRAGDVVICGSVTPPLPLSPATTVEFELSPLRPITVHTA